MAWYHDTGLDLMRQRRRFHPIQIARHAALGPVAIDWQQSDVDRLLAQQRFHAVEQFRIPRVVNRPGPGFDNVAKVAMLTPIIFLGRWMRRRHAMNGKASERM